MTHDLPDEDPRFYDPWDLQFNPLTGRLDAMGGSPEPELHAGTAIQELYDGPTTPWVVAQLAGWTLARRPSPRLPGWDTPPEEAP